MPYATMSNFQSSSPIFFRIKYLKLLKIHYSINNIIDNLKKIVILFFFLINLRISARVSAQERFSRKSI